MFRLENEMFRDYIITKGLIEQYDDYKLMDDFIYKPIQDISKDDYKGELSRSRMVALLIDEYHDEYFIEDTRALHSILTMDCRERLKDQEEVDERIFFMDYCRIVHLVIHKNRFHSYFYFFRYFDYALHHIFHLQYDHMYFVIDPRTLTFDLGESNFVSQKIYEDLGVKNYYFVVDYLNFMQNLYILLLEFGPQFGKSKDIINGEKKFLNDQFLYMERLVEEIFYGRVYAHLQKNVHTNQGFIKIVYNFVLIVELYKILSQSEFGNEHGNSYHKVLTVQSLNSIGARVVMHLIEVTVQLRDYFNTYDELKYVFDLIYICCNNFDTKTTFPNKTFFDCMIDILVKRKRLNIRECMKVFFLITIERFKKYFVKNYRIFKQIVKYFRKKLRYYKVDQVFTEILMKFFWEIIYDIRRIKEEKKQDVIYQRADIPIPFITMTPEYKFQITKEDILEFSDIEIVLKLYFTNKIIFTFETNIDSCDNEGLKLYQTRFYYLTKVMYYFQDVLKG